MTRSKRHCDILVIGGGFAGLAAALGCAKNGFEVVVIDRQDLNNTIMPDFDGRTCALSFSSRRLLESLGLWDEIELVAGPIWDIRIVDGDSPLFLHFDHATVSNQPMGHIVENRHLRMALLSACQAHENITLLSPVSFENIMADDHQTVVTTHEGHEITAGLVIAADGRNSQARQQMGIDVWQRDYGQSAIICTTRQELAHDGVAIERFMPAGPFAILPLKDPNLASVVWTEKTEQAKNYMAMNKTQKEAELQSRFGDFLGNVSLEGECQSYPLNFVLAKRYVAKRFVAVADAAHGMHPIAGQGLNLGLRDIEVLLPMLVEQKRLGLNFASDTMLQSYNQKRKTDVLSMMGSTDALVRLFSNDIAPVRVARRLGIAAVHRIEPLKKFFIKRAMGL